MELGSAVEYQHGFLERKHANCDGGTDEKENQALTDSAIT